MSEYEVLAVRYGTLQKRSEAQNFFASDAHDVPMPLDFYVWVIKGEGRTIVVDTGFTEETAKKRNRTILRPVAESLKAAGVDPESVGDVIITHMHYDHAGNHDILPNARYHVQEKEMHFCTGRCMCHGAMRHAFEGEDVVAMVRRLYEGRVAIHDGASQLADGISLHLAGGHTPGMQFVRVRTRRGWVVLASDTAHFYANMDQSRPFPLFYDMGDMMAGFAALKAAASSDNHIIPGHDPLVLSRYPAAPGGAPDIVRVDLDPL